MNMIKLIVKPFSIKPMKNIQKITNKKQYQLATERIEALLKVIGNDTNPNDPKFIELDNLSDVVAEYEEAHYPVPKPGLIETIRLRMFERDLKQKDLAHILGTSSARVSEYLAGKRKLTFDVAKSIHKNLNIDAGIILNA